MKIKKIENLLKEELEATIKKSPLKRILNSNEAYRILDNSEAEGSTWCAGGCAILAFALNMVYDYPIFIIYDYDWDQIDHFVVKTPNNTYVDCDGEQIDIVKNFKRKEHFERPDVKLGLLPYSKTLKNNGIVIDMEASKRLAELIKQKSISEGVADTYADKEFGMQSDLSKYDRNYEVEDKKTIGYISRTDWGFRLKHPVPIIKNPSNPNSLSTGTRGVIANTGDLYVDGINIAENKLIHNDIVEFLANKGIVAKNFQNWQHIEKYKKDFICVQLIMGVWKIGESYFLFPENTNEREKELKYFEPYFLAAKEKNPTLNYKLVKSNEKFGIKPIK